MRLAILNALKKKRRKKERKKEEDIRLVVVNASTECLSLCHQQPVLHMPIHGNLPNIQIRHMLQICTNL